MEIMSPYRLGVGGGLFSWNVNAISNLSNVNGSADDDGAIDADRLGVECLTKRRRAARSELHGNNEDSASLDQPSVR